MLRTAFVVLAVAVASGARRPTAHGSKFDPLAQSLRRKLEGGIELHPYVVMLRGETSSLDSASLQLAAVLESLSDDSSLPEFGAHVGSILSTGLKGVLALQLSKDAAAWLVHHKSVEFVEPDIILHATVLPGEYPDIVSGNAATSRIEGLPFLPAEGAVAQFDAPSSLDRIDQRKLPLDATYRYTGNGEGVDVYILDSGVRTSHKEFTGRYISGANFSPDQADDDWTDCAGHGTHVASLAVGTNLGVAKGATLVPVRVYDCDNSGPLSQALAGIDWTIAKLKERGNKAVINMSYGGPQSTVLNRAVTQLTDAGSLVVVAAGNDAVDACGISPASAKDALTVGAINSDDTFAPYSNHGRCVDILAPGTSIPGASITSDSAVKLMSGSSMAAPIVTGSAARFLQAQGNVGPRDAKSTIICSSTEGAVREVPKDTTDKLLYDPPGGWTGQQGCAVGGAGADATGLNLPYAAAAACLLVSGMNIAALFNTDV